MCLSTCALIAAKSWRMYICDPSTQGDETGESHEFKASPSCIERKHLPKKEEMRKVLIPIFRLLIKSVSK